MRRFTLLFSILVWLVLWGALKLVEPPIPASVITLFMTITTVTILVFVMADNERFQAFLNPLIRLLREDRLAIPRLACLIVLPLVTAYVTYERVRPRFEPGEARSVHPEAPTSFKLQGKDFDVLGARRPPELVWNDGSEVAQSNLKAGRRIYYRNCMFCHGDYLNGNGHFAEAFNPLPANFRDGGTIAQLEETYVLWRVATGGPGLPQGATPWSSSMPVWQDFLTEEEIWQVVGFIYHASGFEPRAKAEKAEGGEH